MIPINAEMNLAVRLLDAMRPGTPRTEGGLTLIPIFGAAMAPEYLWGKETRS